MKRSHLRTMLASAALAAAVGLAGCDTDSVVPGGRAQAPLSDKMLSEIADKNMDKDSPILARIFKEEAEMEVWKKTRDGQYALLKTYPICRWSGDLGPKKREGDRQAPEGFYTITPGQMNPASNYYLAFNTGFPNAYDRAMGYTGSELMVHGDCSSRGCYAMTDEQIQEIYALARESFFGGQRAFQLQAFPFRMTAMNMAKHRNNPSFAFWKMIKEGYDHFEATRQEPKVAVCEKRYVFDAAAPENASKPLSFNAAGKCPAYELDKTVADAVLDHRRDEQVKMAEYIASGVSTVPPRHGVDGGMNPVFAEKLGTQEGYDSKGRLIRVATAPGSLPRSADKPAPATQVSVPENVAVASATNEAVAPAPVVMANVPMPPAAPQAKVGQAPAQSASITGLLGGLFGGSTGQANASEGPAQNVALRGTNTDLAAKPRRAPTMQTASAPSKPAPKPAAVASNASAEKPAAKPAKDEKRDPELRTAYSTPPATNGSGSLLSGAQPLVPTGTFDSRWSGLR